MIEQVQGSTVVAQAMVFFEAAAAECGELDRSAGDGDLGVTIRAGARDVQSRMATLPADCSWAEVAREAGEAFASAAPSTFGALLGRGVASAAPALSPTSQNLASFARDLEAYVVRRGKADRGDKTMLDVIGPIADALETPISSAERFAEAVACAAERAAQATAGLIPRMGRASWIGERVREQPDAGAVAVARLVRALAEAYLGKSPHAQSSARPAPTTVPVGKEGPEGCGQS